MRVLVLAPMETEYSYFKSSLSKFSNLKNLYRVAKIGVGKASAASETALELYGSNYHFDFVFLVGFAASSSFYKQGDFVFPSFARYHDAHCPQGVCPDLERIYTLEGPDECTILTGDSFVDKTLSKSLQKSFGQKVLFDMEAASVAQIVFDLGIPFLVGKVVSDVPELDSNNLQSFEEFVQTHTDFAPFINYVEMLV